MAHTPPAGLQRHRVRFADRVKRSVLLGTAAILITLGAACSARLAVQGPNPDRVQAVRLNTLGVANMTQQRGEAALELFRQSFATDPTFQTARLNEAIALLNLQRQDEALAIFDALTTTLDDNPGTWYNLGLTYRNLGRSAEAADAFSRAAELAPEDPDTHYQMGLMLAQTERYEDAAASYQRALGLAPYHASATFGMARAFIMRGMVEEATEWNARYLDVTSRQLDTPMGSAYGDQGPYSLAQDASDLARRPGRAVAVRFTAVDAVDFRHTRGDAASGAVLGPGACVLDFDRDRRPDLFLPDGSDNGAVLFRNTGGTFTPVPGNAGIAFGGGSLGCVAGDYDNDGTTDLVVGTSDGIRLFHNDGSGVFEDVTSAAGLDSDAGTGFPLGINFVDYDHDGDVDLYVVRSARLDLSGPTPVLPENATRPGNVLFRNNGDGTFTDQTAETGLEGVASGVAAIGTDLNNDRAVDFVLTGWGPDPGVYLNPRAGAFAGLEWTAESAAPTVGVVVADFDKDTYMDLAFTHWGAPGLSLWHNDQGTAFTPIEVPVSDWDRGWGLAAIDYDNDGWMDLAAVGDTTNGGQIRMLRNMGLDGFTDVSVTLGLDAIALDAPRALVTADYDGDGDVDLIVTNNGGDLVTLRNDGGNRNNWLRIDLEGLADNRNGIGTKVEMFSGLLRQKVEVVAGSGYLGQSASPVVFGMADNTSADTVRMLWPTGVPQDETELMAREAHAILESDRRGSSCPVLFCWNGETYGFVTDAIGAGVVGHWVGPGQRNISDPTEYIKVPGDQVALRDGMISFRLAEPMEELVYLDQVRLIAVDHPEAIEVYPHEYFAAVPPFPEFEVITSRDARPPAGAWDTAGTDVIDRLSRIDRVYVDGFDQNPTPFKGFDQTHRLELDLGDVDTSGPLRLLMHGYVDYFSATSVFAAHQAGVEAILPYIEAQDSSGEWVRVIDDLGFPAGLIRTMARDITGRLPEGTERIRLTTNLKTYWDQILIDTSPSGLPVRMTPVPLAGATLGWLGYPRAAEGSIASDVRYVYDDRSPTGPYARHAGAYTRYGNVTDLTADGDDMFAIFGSGEEVAIEFDPSGLPELDPGWTRDYLFYADGFAKDMDFYEAHASTVEPLPFHTVEPYPYPSGAAYPDSEEYLRYVLEMNTRHESGTPESSYRYDYEDRE